MPSEPIEKLRELVKEWRRCRIFSDCADELEALLLALERRERELREALSAAIECIEEHIDTPGTEFSRGKEYGSVASFVDDWRAALNPTEPRT